VRKYSASAIDPNFARSEIDDTLNPSAPPWSVDGGTSMREFSQLKYRSYLITLMSVLPTALGCEQPSLVEVVSGSRSEALLPQCVFPAPSASPRQNRLNIQYCLDNGGAELQGSYVYQVDGALKVPDNAILVGDNGKATIRLVNVTPGAVDHLVAIHSNGLIRSLKLDGNLLVQMEQSCPTTRGMPAIVHMVGSGSVVEECWLYNHQQPSSDYMATSTKNTGVIFCPNAGAECSNNVVRNCDMFWNASGALFGHNLISTKRNTIEGGHIHANTCDGVNMKGFGILSGVLIENNGWDCDNGSGDLCHPSLRPIPAAGIFASETTHGGEILGNTIQNNCGHNLDFDRVSGFYIADNQIHLPGNTSLSSDPTLCRGAVSVSFFDVSDSTLERNVITNNGRWTNRMEYSYVPLVMWSDAASSMFLDFHAGHQTTIAFVMAKRRVAEPGFMPANRASGNAIVDNQIRSACSASLGCSGVGYFASRGTGYDDHGGWRPNIYRRNTPFGSNVGSTRCGGNWYAADYPCSSPTSHPECNWDDYQHGGLPSSPWSPRNDGCELYPN
jgi:hypothetical protein